MHVTRIKQKQRQKPIKKIEIKTNFDFPIEDESITLESNINKIGINLEEEKSDLESKVELLKKLIVSNKT